MYFGVIISSIAALIIRHFFSHAPGNDPAAIDDCTQQRLVAPKELP